MIALRRACQVVLLLAVAVVAVQVTRDFVRYIDHYPYLAADDALANVSYSLGTEGRYGFLTSPVQGFSNAQRHQGFFNYGPWYFYAGAALVWLFGYSLEALRALHLMGILAIAGIACLWFGRRGSLAAGAMVALGVLYNFGTNQWPMVRPDIAVSVFAVLFIVAAGAAIESRRAPSWFLAGLAAGCGALTHLIAWSLVIACVAVCVLACAIHRASLRQSAVNMLAAGLGLTLAALMFYGSFDFRIRDQVSALSGYGQFLGGTNTAAAGIFAIIGNHLFQAFWQLSVRAQVALAAGVAVSLAVLISGLRHEATERRRVVATLLPPIAVLGLYLASLAIYPNYHAGYAILIQVAVWWCMAAGLSVLLWRFASRSPVVEMAVVLLVAASAVPVSAGLAGAQRLDYVRDWISISDYTDKVREVIPPREIAWGSALFGIETPGRIQIVEAAEAVMTLQRARASRTIADGEVAPAYLVWGYPNNRDNLLQALRPVGHTTNVFNRIHHELPSVYYRPIALVAAAPYGVTRVYARAHAHDAPLSALPAVNVFDVDSQQWHNRIEGPIPSDFAPAPAVTFDVDYALTGGVPANRSVVADLPAGRLLLRVRVGRSSPSARPTVVGVTSTPSFTQQIGDLGPAVDFAPYAGAESTAYLIHQHGGGPLYVSEFDAGEGASIQHVDVYRILPPLRDEQRAAVEFHALPPAESWLGLSPPSGNARAAGNALIVVGDTSEQGYQVQSPPVAAIPGATVTLFTEFSGEAGKLCVGALDESGNRWLANGGDPARDFSFVVKDSNQFRVVFYNCNPSATGNAPSRFRIDDIRYTMASPGLYVDHLMSLLEPAVVALSEIVSAPPGLRVTAAELARPTNHLRGSAMAFQASIANENEQGWAIKGLADAPYTYLLQSNAQGLASGRRLVVEGHLTAGGLTVGLLRDGAWEGQIAITTPGRFTAIVQAPRRGSYAAVIANHSTDRAVGTDVVITRFGWLEP